MRIGKQLLDQVIAIAKTAGAELLKIYHQDQPLNIQLKEDLSPVTIADLTAHNIIAEGLSKLTPDIPLLSEEGPLADYSIREQWECYWLVDPLDGTREFINRHGQFTVNIALIKNQTPILGVIYVPLKNQLYFAAQGVGSFFQEAETEAVSLAVRKWDLGEELILVTTRRELHIDFHHHIAQLCPVKITYRSSSIKFCLLAQGQADIYLRKKPIQEWDTAAGHCILINAGGVVLDSNWQPLRYNTKPRLLSPPFIAIGDTKQLLPILTKLPIF